MPDPATLSWDALIREYYHPAPFPYPSRIDALREEIRRRVDAVRQR